MFYIVARWICRCLLKIIGRWQIEGKANMPATGGIIIASNHTSNIDPVVIGCTFDRRVSYLAKEELFKIPVLSWVCRQLGAFPIKRGAGDRGAIRETLKILQDGLAFGIFPEGTRSKDGKLQAGKPGIAMVALKAKVPVIPVGMLGTQQGRNIRVKIGQPISFPEYWDKKVSKEDLEVVTAQIMAEIAKLIEE